MMGRKRLQYSRTLSLHNPTSQLSARGPLQQDKLSLHKQDTCEKTRERHQIGPWQNPNSRDRRERRDYNRAVRIGEMMTFLAIGTAQA